VYPVHHDQHEADNDGEKIQRFHPVLLSLGAWVIAVPATRPLPLAEIKISV
jgi:hypothetical protein